MDRGVVIHSILSLLSVFKLNLFNILHFFSSKYIFITMGKSDNSRLVKLQNCKCDNSRLVHPIHPSIHPFKNCRIGQGGLDFISGEEALDRASALLARYNYIGQGGPGSSVDRANDDRAAVIAPY